MRKPDQRCVASQHMNQMSNIEAEIVGIIYHGVGFLRSPAFWKRIAPTLALAQAEFPRVGMISLANQCSVSVGSM
jgi:hypothetical protein